MPPLRLLLPFLAAPVLLTTTSKSISSSPRAAVTLRRDRTAGALEVVAEITGSMPTGVTVSREGRVFINYPRWGDPVPFTVAEVKAGKPAAYPNAEINRLDRARARDTFVSVQSMVVDPRNRLWILDTGSVEFGPVIPGGAKLIGIDLAANRVIQSIVFPPDVALPTSYLNDVRFDLRRGPGGVAYIADSADQGPNALFRVKTGATPVRLR